MSTCEHDRQDDVCWECKDAQLATALQRVAELEEEDRCWEKHSLMQIVKDRATLRAQLAQCVEALKDVQDYFSEKDFVNRSLYLGRVFWGEVMPKVDAALGTWEKL